MATARKGNAKVLRNARTFLSDEAHRYQGDTQKDGKKSLLGEIGLNWSSFEGDLEPIKRAAGYLALAIGREGEPYDYVHVQGFSDTHTHAEVLAVLDRAIDLAELQPNRGFRRPGNGYYGRGTEPTT
jgi:hypothetical protein